MSGELRVTMILVELLVIDKTGGSCRESRCRALPLALTRESAMQKLRCRKSLRTLLLAAFNHGRCARNTSPDSTASSEK
jgi:hypothetical protein